jgi:hypothetical protein
LRKSRAVVRSGTAFPMMVVVRATVFENLSRSVVIIRAQGRSARVSELCWLDDVRRSFAAIYFFRDLVVGRTDGASKDQSLLLCCG